MQAGLLAAMFSLSVVLLLGGDHRTCAVAAQEVDSPYIEGMMEIVLQPGGSNQAGMMTLINHT